MKGVWVAFHFDMSGLAVFDTEDELGARRYADEHNMSVHFVLFGHDVRQQILHPERTADPNTSPFRVPHGST